MLPAAFVLVTASALATMTAGVQLRADPTAHPARLEVGWLGATLEAALVLDPWFFIDGQHDLDLHVLWPLGAEAFWGAAGVRSTVVRLPGEAAWQHVFVAGSFADLPPLGRGLRLQAGVELGVLLLTHGAGVSASFPLAGGASPLEALSGSIVLRALYGP